MSASKTMVLNQLNVEQFESISLEEMDQVKLMNRMDTKYWFHRKDLPAILDKIHNDYYMLNIGGYTEMPYSTTYYDTEENSMFIAHHNGKLNRFKVRKRTYETSGISFLEVKFKNNKGRTIKERIPTPAVNGTFSNDEQQFLKVSTPYSGADLKPTLKNHFTRIMLVSKNFDERCTIDFNLTFSYQDVSRKMDKLVVVEIKADKSSAHLPMAKALNAMRLKPSGFSKYCMGRALVDRSIKKNAFKPKIRSLEKLQELNLNAG